jgi:hypothetical protein
MLLAAMFPQANTSIDFNTSCYTAPGYLDLDAAF